MINFFKHYNYTIVTKLLLTLSLSNARPTFNYRNFKKKRFYLEWKADDTRIFTKYEIAERMLSISRSQSPIYQL